MSAATLAAVAAKQQKDMPHQQQMNSGMVMNLNEEDEDDGRIRTTVHNPDKLGCFDSFHVDPVDLPSFHVSKSNKKNDNDVCNDDEDNQIGL